MAVINLNEQSFNELINKSPIPVVVDFWAAWCGPCKMMAPILDELSEQYEGKVVIAKINVDDEPALAMKYQIDSIPNVKLFANGTYKDESIGLKPKEAMQQWIDGNLI